jgi:hypothetical protein
MTMVDPKDHLDRRYEDTPPSELPDAPVDALRGLGKAGSEGLRKAIGVKTIRDLATNQFVLAAQELMRLAEGKAVAPTAPAPGTAAVAPVPGMTAAGPVPGTAAAGTAGPVPGPGAGRPDRPGADPDRRR